MSKDIIFKEKPEKKVEEWHPRRFDRKKLLPLIDFSQHSIVLPTDLIEAGDEFYDFDSEIWRKAHALNYRAGNKAIYRRRRYF